jgi:dCMP deaminase
MTHVNLPTLNEKWDRRFLALAREISTWSKDPNTKVGAVIVSSDRRIVSVGYNGLSQYIEDSLDILNNRELKLQVVLHAEENAVLNCLDRNSLWGSTIYTYPMPPCAHCSSVLIQAGVMGLVSLEDYAERWKDSIQIALDQFKQSNVSVTLY